MRPHIRPFIGKDPTLFRIDRSLPFKFATRLGFGLFLALFLALFLGSLVLTPKAYASEGIFSYLYTAETTPGGSWEYEQKHVLHSGKARGNYTSLDVRNEFEYGITDRLQGALYINSSYQLTNHLYDPDDVSKDISDKNEFDVDGVSVELMYRVLSPFKDGLGVAVYIEPELSVRDHMTGEDKIERALEARLILQKNFFDDQLITAMNLMLEPEWERSSGNSAKELWAEITAGASYRFRANWFAGLEFRNHMEYPDMNLGNQEHSAYFFGPTLHYGAETYWWTLTFLPQVTGWPRQLGTGADGQMIESSYAHLGQHEKYELKFAFGIPLDGGHSHHD
jgi:hypothetical protein